jgi:hypothetical protein
MPSKYQARLPEARYLGDELLVQVRNNMFHIVMIRPVYHQFANYEIDLTCPCDGCSIWREVYRVWHKYLRKKPIGCVEGAEGDEVL